MTLRDLMLKEDGEVYPLYDGPSGRPLTDEDGKPDDPADYVVAAFHRVGGYSWAVVRDPSGNLDVHGPDAGEMHRDVVSEPRELYEWVNKNYPS